VFTKAVVDDSVLANVDIRMLLLVIPHEDVRQFGDSFVGDIDEIEVFHFLDYIFWVGVAPVHFWWLVCESEWHERTVVDDGVAWTALVTALKATIEIAVGVLTGILMVIHDCGGSCWWVEDWGDRGGRGGS